MDYKKKHAVMRREARATLIAAALVMVFWWVTGFGLQHTGFTIFYMPGWFVVSCFGSWLLSILLVIYLINRVFTDFSLDDEDQDGCPAEGKNAPCAAEEKQRGAAGESP